MWSSTGNTRKDVDLCRIGIVLNYLTMFYCKSCSGYFSTWICVLYLWVVTSGVFYILVSISFLFCVFFLFVWEMCKLRFSYPLNRQGINFRIIWGTALSQYKGVYAPFCLCLRMSDHLNCQFLTVFKETLTEERKKPFRVYLQGTEVSKEDIFNDIYILSFPSWISMG